ncbi:aminotransferase class V-fold PLP-dependent enzyme [Candidatus Alkanophaga liquidiphilum]
MARNMDVKRIRADFPILNEVTYMDSASTSLTPEPVLKEVLSYYREFNANVGRGVHRLSQVASQKYEEVRKKVAAFIGAKETEIIFTKNATEAINIVASGLRWKRGDKIVTSSLEHHSNFLPWMQLRRVGVKVEVVRPRNGVLHAEDFESVVDKRTKLVALTHASNVLGTLSPVEEIARICEERGALLLIDGSQSAPHMPIDVRKLGCDFLAFSGHKMLGPKGTGVLFMREQLLDEVEPLLVGGGIVEEVSLNDFRLVKGCAKFEAGTPNVAGVIGLESAVSYLRAVGMEKIRRHEARLTEKILDGLSSIEGVEVYALSAPQEQRIGVVSFNVKDLNPHDVALILSEANIMVRSGHHCCMPLMKELGVDGTVRASLYLYNTEEEVESFLEVVEGIARSF